MISKIIRLFISEPKKNKTLNETETSGGKEMPIIDGIIVNGTTDKIIDYDGKVIINNCGVTITEKIVEKKKHSQKKAAKEEEIE